MQWNKYFYSVKDEMFHLTRVASLNGRFHLSPHKNICTTAGMRKHSLFVYHFLRLDVRGHPNHIYISDHGREPMLRISAEQVLPVYRALKKFSAIYHHPDNVYVYKMQEGKVFIVILF